MNDYIKRSDVMSTLKTLTRMADNFKLMAENFKESIKDVSKTLDDLLMYANVVEMKHGYWILEREPNGKPYCFHCSVCDSDFKHINIMVQYDFCPNCGARMDGKEQNNG